MNATLNETIKKFISKKSNYYFFKKSTVENLIYGSGRAEGAMSFYDILGDSVESNVVDKEIYVSAIKETVLSYSSTKDSAISIFKMLTAYIEKEMNCSIEINFPPIPVSNTFERLMFISKYFHDPNNKVENLRDILWVSERTIEDDLAKLRGYDEDPIQICGKKFVIEDTTRSDGTIYFKSTVHPFFLTSNLTQVVAMLKGLNEMSKLPEWKGYADTMAAQIWQQLSDYGRRRIKYVLSELMKDDLELVNNLDHLDERSFYGEYYCSSVGSNGLLMSMKSGEPANVEYMTNEGSEIMEGVLFKNYEENKKFLVEYNGKEILLERDKIIKSSINKMDMF